MNRANEQKTITEVPLLAKPLAGVMEKLKEREQRTREAMVSRTPEQWADIERRREEDERPQKERERQRAVAQLAGQLGRRYGPDRCTLERFEVTNNEQAEVKGRVVKLAAQLPDLVEEGRSVVFFGTVGAGKDHLLKALLYCAAGHGLSCHWVSAQQIYSTLRDRMDTGGREEEIFARLVAPQILAISDPVPPGASLSDWRVEVLYRIIDRRYCNLQPTWMTLNAASPEDAEERLSSQVWDRLQESAELIPCFWPSWRERPLTVARASG